MSNLYKILNPNAWRGNKTAQGIIAVENVVGDLIPKSFQGGHFYGEGTGITFNRAGFIDNQDGSGSHLKIIIPSGSDGEGARIWLPFHGNVFGLRWLRDSTAPPFTVLVDGRAYPVTHYQDERLVGNQITVVDSNGFYVIAKDLGDFPHVAEIAVTQHASLTRTLIMYGYLVEKRAGYLTPSETNQQEASGILTNAQVAFIGASPAATNAKFMRGIQYNNVDGAATHLVQVKRSGILQWQATVPIGGCSVWDTLGYMPIDNSYTHGTDSNTAIQWASLMGGR